MPSHLRPDSFSFKTMNATSAAKNGETERFTNAPYNAPMKRLDETGAARNPILRWRKPEEA